MVAYFTEVKCEYMSHSHCVEISTTIITSTKSLTDGGNTILCKCIFSISHSNSYDLYNVPNLQKMTVSPSELPIGNAEAIQYSISNTFYK